MSFLLDTNVLSETTRAQPNPKVLDWIAGQAPDSLFISVITIGELRRGAQLLDPGKKRKALLDWIEASLKIGFVDRILPLDTIVMEHWADLVVQCQQNGRQLPLMDSLIAATARAHDFTVATRNTADFIGSGARLINPWK